MDKDQILEEIDQATRPDRMDAEDAIIFLEELASDLYGRIEALREENDL